MASRDERELERIKLKKALAAKQPSGKVFGTSETRAASPLSSLMGAKRGAGAGVAAGLGSDSAASGAVQGATAAGPIGAVAGGALGLVKGIAAQKKKKRELKAQSIREQGANIQATAKEKNAALKNIMDGLRAAFLG